MGLSVHNFDYLFKSKRISLNGWDDDEKIVLDPRICYATTAPIHRSFATLRRRSPSLLIADPEFAQLREVRK